MPTSLTKSFGKQKPAMADSDKRSTSDRSRSAEFASPACHYDYRELEQKTSTLAKDSITPAGKPFRFKNPAFTLLLRHVISACSYSLA